jgi:hypothetical protein
MNHRNRYILCLLPMVFAGCGLSLFGQGTPARSQESVARELDEIGRIATVMMDGDLCQRIMTRRSLEQMFALNPKDRWAASDNFEVHHEPYIQAKKTLIRLSRLVPYACDVNLWKPFKERPDKIQVLIRNVNEWSQFWTWGALTQDMPVEMKRVLGTGKREQVTRKPGMISILAPVYDSLGDIVALVEVVAVTPGVEAPQVHARNKDVGFSHHGFR